MVFFGHAENAQFSPPPDDIAQFTALDPGVLKYVVAEHDLEGIRQILHRRLSCPLTLVNNIGKFVDNPQLVTELWIAILPYAIVMFLGIIRDTKDILKRRILL
jgi:hypothetical protein